MRQGLLRLAYDLLALRQAMLALFKASSVCGRATKPSPTVMAALS